MYLFEDLDRELFDEVLLEVRERHHRPEQWLCFHGETAESFYLVLEGEVALLRHSAQGDELIVAIVGPGELFAEDLAFLESANHLLSARTLGPVRVATIDRRRFRSVLDRQPRLLGKLLNTLHRRNSILLEELESVTIHSASERLMTFLESQVAGSGPLRIPKRVLASRLSIRPETLSRVLAQLKACQRLEEIDGCLLPVAPRSEADEACGLCPARIWGCPGPRREVREPAGLPAATVGGR